MTKQEPHDYCAERAELETILNTGIFSRSASLALFLKYICQRTFEGNADQIKEYNVATQALGRPADFDQKKDSIVRVEAHRLRKKLQDYYSGPGRSHTLQIRLPSGSYVPQFDRIEPETLLSLTPPPVSEIGAIPAIALPEPKPRRPDIVTNPPQPAGLWIKRFGIIAGLALIVVLLVVSAYRVRAFGPESPESATVIADRPIPQPGPEVRLLAGSSVARYVDRLGNQWGPDRFFIGGDAANVPPRPIARSLDPVIFLNRREGEFAYDIPLNPGTYELRLYFAETVFGEGNVAGGGESSRIFSVLANGKPLFSAADMLSDVGGSNTANVKVFKDIRPDAAGKLHLEFRPTMKEKPFINAIEIVPGTPGRMLPVRIVARDTPVGKWQPDHFYTGGQMVLRHERVAGADESEIFQNERYGNFSYAIPVAENSRYTVKLYFCESWFGPGRPGGGGAGARQFDVYLNGEALLRNFDIFREAGGCLRALTRTFRHIAPNAQGKLVLQFVPIRNYALINAIEVTDETQ